MSQISGTLYNNKNAKGEEASLSQEFNKFVIKNNAGETLFSCPAKFIKVSSKVGKIPRTISFPNGMCLVCQQTSALDDFLKNYKLAGNSSFLHGLENRWDKLLLLTGLTVSIILLMFFYIIPKSSEKLHKYIPQSYVEQVSKETMQILKSRYIKESTLDPELRKKYNDIFLQVKKDFPKLKLKLDFYHSRTFGANAMALPNGQIFFTDALIKLIDKDEEFIGILIHEIAHIQHKHSVKSLVKQTGISFMLSLMFDNSKVAGLSSSLLKNSYSRDDERESDLFAIEYFKNKDLNLLRFAEILEKMSRSHPEISDKLSIFSSHPITEERLRMIKDANSSD